MSLVGSDRLRRIAFASAIIIAVMRRQLSPLLPRRPSAA
jgi:hypothetical protein